MKIITTTTLEISPENEALIPIVVAKNGGQLDGETIEQSIARIRNDAANFALRGQVIPNIRAYFGEKDSATAEAILAAIDAGAIHSETVIEA